MLRILTICALLCGSTALFAQHTLQYKFKKGDTFHVEQEAIQNMDQDIEGTINKNKNTITAKYSFTVDSVFTDRFVLTTVFDMMQFRSESNTYGVFLDVDTEKSTEGMDEDALLMHQIFSAMLNQPITVNLHKTGKVISIKGTEAMIDAMLDEVGIEEEFARNMVKKQVEKDFGDEGLAESMEQLFYLYPNNEVSVGDSWKNSYTGALEAENVWTLKEYGGDEFVLNATADVTLDEVDSDSGVQVTLVGNQETIAIIEKDNGFIKEVTIDQVTKGATKLQGMNFPTTMVSKITFKRL